MAQCRAPDTPLGRETKSGTAPPALILLSATPLLTKPLSTVPLLWMFTFTHSDLLLPSHAQRPPALSKLNSDTAHHKPATDKKQAAGPGFCDL